MVNYEHELQYYRLWNNSGGGRSWGVGLYCRWEGGNQQEQQGHQKGKRLNRPGGTQAVDNTTLPLSAPCPDGQRLTDGILVWKAIVIAEIASSTVRVEAQSNDNFGIALRHPMF